MELPECQSFRSQMRAKLWPLQQPKVNADRKQGTSTPTVAVVCCSVHLLPAPLNFLGLRERSPDAPRSSGVYVCVSICRHTHVPLPKLVSVLTDIHTQSTEGGNKGWGSNSSRQRERGRDSGLASLYLCSGPSFTTTASSQPRRLTL